MLTTKRVKALAHVAHLGQHGDADKTEDAFRRNRRIELKLTER